MNISFRDRLARHLLGLLTRPRNQKLASQQGADSTTVELVPSLICHRIEANVRRRVLAQSPIPLHKCHRRADHLSVSCPDTLTAPPEHPLLDTSFLDPTL